jgi:hypothetical protein
MAEGNGSDNKKLAYTIGGVVLALGALFAVLNGIPWQTKTQADEQQQSVAGQIADLKSDIAGVKADQKQDTAELRGEIQSVAGEVQHLEDLMLQNRAALDPPAHRKIEVHP